MHRTHVAPVLLMALAGTSLAADPPAPLWPPFPAQLDPASLTPDKGIVLNGGDERGLVGTYVSGAGDFNGDGIDDFIVGDRFSDPNGIDRAGRAFVVFGHPTPRPADIDGERRADLNGDGAVDVLDFAILAAGFGASVPPGTGADLDADGEVGVFDFALFVARFGSVT